MSTQDEIFARRFGSDHEKSCNHPHVTTCARWECQDANECQFKAAAAFPASSILREAADIVDGARPATHGPRERSFNAIAVMWTAYLASRRNPTGPIRTGDVAHMMSLLKKMRAEWGQSIRDHAVDDSAYAAIAGELTDAR